MFLSFSVYPIVLMMASSLVGTNFMTQAYATPSGKSRVFVSGAGGQTGQALFRKLLERPDEFDVVGGVRTEESRSRVLDSMEENLKASSSSCVNNLSCNNAGQKSFACGDPTQPIRPDDEIVVLHYIPQQRSSVSQIRLCSTRWFL